VRTTEVGAISVPQDRWWKSVERIFKNMQLFFRSCRRVSKAAKSHYYVHSSCLSVCMSVRSQGTAQLSLRIFVKVYIGRCYTDIHLWDSGSGKIILNVRTFTIRANLEVYEIKAIPVEAWTAPEDSRRSKLPNFQTTGISRWQVCQLYARAAFTP
jgi:hypothetical protein